MSECLCPSRKASRPTYFSKPQMHQTKPTRIGWTAEHIAILREHYPTQGAAWVAQRTGHSVNSVGQYAVKLGVRCVVSKRKGGTYKCKPVAAIGTVIVAAKPSVRGPAYNSGAVDMSRAVITRAPTPLGRYAVDADYVGGFALVGVGHDIQSGQVWV